jgi:hypothetical protein
MAGCSSSAVASRQTTAPPNRREFDIAATDGKNNSAAPNGKMSFARPPIAELFTMMRSHVFLLASGLFLLLCAALPLRADYPQPSPFPVSWELTLTHAQPRRIVVQCPGDAAPTAYWYLTYHVTNNTDRDKILLYPTFDMVLEDGQVIRNDHGIAPAVFDAIKRREHLKYLQSADVISGELRQGEDQSKDAVAIWPEPRLRMGTFSIFCTGFWGETATVKEGDKDVTLRKTLQLTYHLDSDENNPGSGTLVDKDSQYVMR